MSRGNRDLKVSRQTVANCLKSFKTEVIPVTEEKSKVKVIYIEADEDHVKVKKRKRTESRLIYIHEGIAEKPRRHLINDRYFSTVKKPLASSGSKLLNLLSYTMTQTILKSSSFPETTVNGYLSLLI